MNLMALGESMLKDDVSLNNNCDIEAWKRKKKNSFIFLFFYHKVKHKNLNWEERFEGFFQKKKNQKIKGTSAK